MASDSPFELSRGRYQQTFLELRELILQVPLESLIAVTVDIPSTIVTVVGCQPERDKHRERIVAANPLYDMTAYDNIERYAIALGHAHARHVIALLPPEPIPDLVAQLQSARTRLTADAEVLAARSLLPREPLQKLRASTSYENLMFDVLALVGVLRQGWGAIAAKTAIEEHELDDAEDLTVRLARAIGLRDHGSEVIDEATQTRQRAFTLFASAYNEVRRIVIFYRWHHDDVNRLAPSIYRGRGGRGKAAKGTEGERPKRKRGRPRKIEVAATIGNGAPDPRRANGVPSDASQGGLATGDPEVKP